MVNSVDNVSAYVMHFSESLSNSLRSVELGIQTLSAILSRRSSVQLWSILRYG